MVYPTLARMAYELYSIPSMSAEVERVFSRYYLNLKSCTDVKRQIDVEGSLKSSFYRISGINRVFI